MSALFLELREDRRRNGINWWLGITQFRVTVLFCVCAPTGRYARLAEFLDILDRAVARPRS